MKSAFLPVILLILASCAPSREKMKTEIEGLEKRLYASSAIQLDTVKGDSLLKLYSRYAEKFPGDSVNAKYLFNAASLAMNLMKSREAVVLLDQFITRYPENPRTPVCVFYKGFIFENQMGDLQKAKEVYLSFIEKYPENDFADDAKNSLDNLGKSPEEMVAEFEKRQKEDSLRNAAVTRK